LRDSLIAQEGEREEMLGDSQRFQATEAIQCLLRVQARHLAAYLGIETFEQRVRDLWLCLVTVSGLEHHQQEINSAVGFPLDSVGLEDTQTSISHLVTEEPKALCSVSESESESEVEDEEGDEERINVRGRKAATGPFAISIKHTLALLYTALLEHGLPLFLADLRRLIFDGHLPYMKAASHVPEKLLKALKKKKAAAFLYPHDVPSIDRIERLVKNVMARLARSVPGYELMRMPLREWTDKLASDLAIPRTLSLSCCLNVCFRHLCGNGPEPIE